MVLRALGRAATPSIGCLPVPSRRLEPTVPTWLLLLDRHFPIRYLTLCVSAALACLGVVLGLWRGTWDTTALLPAGLGVLCTAIGVHDHFQTRHAVLRNYPVIGHLRFLLEWIRPEIRQYFIESDNEAAPFSRQQRSLVYQRAKGESDKRPFGTQLDVQAEGYEWLNHSMTPTALDSHDFRVTIGAARAQPYEMSVFNISAMSFGALSAHAIQALNLGARRGGFAHDTGEGSISRYHREHGGDLVWEIGSGYFGCRDAQGRFDPARFAEQARAAQVKLIELKLSQGAKPGHGGMLPGKKVTIEIAEARGVPAGLDCISPASHSAFSTPIEMLQFIERLRTLSGGKPTGFKFAVGHPWEWFALVKAMLLTGIVPDFIVVDGAEGGTGAAPQEFADHVGAPLQEGLLLVHNTLVGVGLRDQIRLGAAGRIVSAFDIARVMALGADFCNAARGFMFALGCIQAQACHSGQCPTGVATQDPRRQRALVVADKAQRVAQFHRQTLEALQELVQAAGLRHPGEISASHIVHRNARHEVKLLSTLLPFVAPGAVLAAARGDAPWPHATFERYWSLARAEQFSADPHALPDPRFRGRSPHEHGMGREAPGTEQSIPRPHLWDPAVETMT
jgi:glutamate synthase domain-containing protein 2